MAHIFKDRVVDSTSTTGTGALTLSAPSLNGYRNVGDVCANGDTIYLTVAHRLLPQWETGRYTYGSGAGTLTRTEILSSSNSDAAVNFSSGIKDVVAGFPAAALSNFIVSPSTDHAIPRFNGTEGLLQNSGITIDDSDNITSPGSLSFSGTGHAGVRLNNLTTAQRDAIASPAAGMLAHNTTTGVPNAYAIAAGVTLGWQELILGGRANTITAPAVGSTPLALSQFSTSQTAPLLSLAVGNSAATNGSWVVWQRPTSVSNNGVNWRVIVNQNHFANGGVGGEAYSNEVIAMGWNLSSTVSAPDVSSKAAIWDTWEYKFNNGGEYGSERHMEALDVSGRLNRWWTAFIPHDGGTGSSMTQAIDSVVWTTSGPTLSVTGAADNGSGLIRLTVASTAGWSTGQRKTVADVGGVSNATGSWTITVVDATHIDLQSSTWAGSHTSGGTIGPVNMMQATLNSRVISFNDSLFIRGEVNNTPLLSQRNAAGDAILNLPWINAANELQSQRPLYIVGARNASPTVFPAMLQILQSTSSTGDYLVYGSMATLTGAGTAWDYECAASTGWSTSLRNTNTAAATAHATQIIQTGGASAGDARVLFTIDGVQSWVAGVDNSDGDAFVISVGSALGTSNALKINTSGVLHIGTHSNIGAESVTGYITIKDAGGTDRKIAVVS